MPLRFPRIFPRRRVTPGRSLEEVERDIRSRIPNSHLINNIIELIAYIEDFVLNDDTRRALNDDFDTAIYRNHGRALRLAVDEYIRLFTIEQSRLDAIREADEVLMEEQARKHNIDKEGENY